MSRVVRNATARFLRANFAMTTGQTVLMRTTSRVAVQLPTMAGDRSLYLLRPLHATTTITANITIISGKRHPWWFLTSPSLLYTTPPDMTDMIRVTVKMEACRPNLLLGQTEAHLCSTLNTKVRRPKMPRLPISLFGPGEIPPAKNAATGTERGGHRRGPPDAATPGANAKVRSVGARSKGAATAPRPHPPSLYSPGLLCLGQSTADNFPLKPPSAEHGHLVPTSASRPLPPPLPPQRLKFVRTKRCGTLRSDQ